MFAGLEGIMDRLVVIAVIPVLVVYIILYFQKRKLGEVVTRVKVRFSKSDKFMIGMWSFLSTLYFIEIIYFFAKGYSNYGEIMKDLAFVILGILIVSSFGKLELREEGITYRDRIYEKNMIKGINIKENDIIMTVSYKKKDKKIKVMCKSSEDSLREIFKEYSDCYVSE